jgi:aminoglycoside phosphotransferase (APT) family kinase protein
MTHEDLHSRNITVDGRGEEIKVTGIVDGNMAGGTRSIGSI